MEVSSPLFCGSFLSLIYVTILILWTLLEQFRIFLVRFANLLGSWILDRSFLCYMCEHSLNWDLQPSELDLGFQWFIGVVLFFSFLHPPLLFVCERMCYYLVEKDVCSNVFPVFFSALYFKYNFFLFLNTQDIETIHAGSWSTWSNWSCNFKAPQKSGGP